LVQTRNTRLHIPGAVFRKKEKRPQEVGHEKHITEDPQQATQSAYIIPCTCGRNICVGEKGKPPNMLIRERIRRHGLGTWSFEKSKLAKHVYDESRNQFQMFYYKQEVKGM
jgi:hypothetical protein